jgi:hypothetical protein
MATKSKMASETNIFLILLSKLQFSTDFKKLECIHYGKNLVSKIQKSGFFEDDVIFEKNDFFSNGNYVLPRK